MNDNIRKITLRLSEMVCVSCERKVEVSLKKLDGVDYVKASFDKQTVSIVYNSDKITIDKIKEKLNSIGYPVIEISNENGKFNFSNIFRSLCILASIFIIYLLFRNIPIFNYAPEIESTQELGMLFVIGIITSVHCVAMCGGINIAQCSKYEVKGESKFSKLYPSFLYNLGRVISYTVVGGIVGLIGSVISFTLTMQSVVIILSGIFMLLMGFSMLNIFGVLRKITPRMPKFIRDRLNKNKSSKGPFVVGLLNGLMPCGPLQAMQIYALSTGSFILGALSMFIFSLGTVPLMFLLGAVTSILNNRFKEKMIKASGALVILLSFFMVDRGLSLSGITIDIPQTNIVNQSTNNTNSSTSTKYTNPATINGEIQEVTTRFKNGRYVPITVQKGIKVRWTIQVEKGDLSGCTNAIISRKYNIDKDLKIGDNIIEFTPTETGSFVYTCWMGMVRSNIKVVDSLEAIPSSNNVTEQESSDDDSSSYVPSCCGSN